MREVEMNVEHRDLFQRGARLPGGAHNNSIGFTRGWRAGRQKVILEQKGAKSVPKPGQI